ncbi:MAG: hypothetical protein HKP61_08535 [Dactylosporangium sp.]|nr:hypothetical protein [Dactylosporangium sp.]NNJ60981.1 hypothetical protein [Dactylosporangium sp.]
MSRPLPAAKHIRDLLEDLLGRTVKISPTDPLRAAEMHQSLVAVYVDDRLKLAAVVGMSFPLTIYASAALGLIPPGGARDFVEERDISPMLAENATEICNIIGTVLNHEGMPHIRLYQTYLPGGAPPPNDAGGRLLALGRRVDLTLEIAGYGGGKFSLSLVE